MYLKRILHAINNNDIRIRTFSLGPEHMKESYLLIFETDFVYTSDLNRVLSVVQKNDLVALICIQVWMCQHFTW